MKKSIIALTVATVMSTTAYAESLTITTGQQGGTYYDVFGVNLGNIMAERGYDVTLQPSLGSVENLERVAKGNAQIGFAQADAYAATNSNVEIIGSLGEECLFIAASETSNVDDEDDLQKEGSSIAVGRQGSGSAVSWDYARKLEEDYMKASTYYQGGVLALGRVKTGQYDAFMWVTSPENLNHKYLQAVRQEGSGLQMIDFNDWDMNDKLPNGNQVYTFRDVKLETGMFADKVEVPCTEVLVVASPDMDYSAMEDLATSVMMDSNRIQGK